MNISAFKSCLLTRSCVRTEIGFQKPLVMGVLNITPDSFSDGGLYSCQDKAILHALEMIEAGADVLDIGAESSRPGANPVSASDELSRILPVIEAVHAQSSIVISVDTTKPAVMRAALMAGAHIVNDITALSDAEAMAVVREFQAPVCLLHMQGTPENMQQKPYYEGSVVNNIQAFFTQRVADCLRQGILREQLILDPGFGFGKTVPHNLLIMKQLSAFKEHNLPLMLGFSRKSTIGEVVQTAVGDRLSAGIALSVWAALQDVFMLRTHDVRQTQQALTMLAAVIDVPVHEEIVQHG